MNENEYFREVFLRAWDQAESFGGDFKDSLMYFLRDGLGFEKVVPAPRGYTDGGVNEMPGDPSSCEANELLKERE